MLMTVALKTSYRVMHVNRASKTFTDVNTVNAVAKQMGEDGGDASKEDKCKHQSQHGTVVCRYFSRLHESEKVQISDVSS